MKVIVCNNKKEATLKAVSFLLREIKRKKNLVLGLATGKTMIGFYRELVRMSKGKGFSKVRTFNLDEYVGLNVKREDSFRYFMDKHFFSKVDIKEENINFLNGKDKNIKNICSDYEREIRKVGGIDLQILGIGRNGHIGFNEPGSSFNSRTREVVLSDETRKDNKIYAGGYRKAITMGLGTITDARKIVLLATGKKKSKAVGKALRGDIDEQVPASILRRHKKSVFVFDKSAASELRKP